MTAMELVERTTKRDAILFYFHFFLRANTRRIENMTYEHFAVALNDRGLSATRASDFTKTTVRACIYELARIGAIERIKRTKTRFDLVDLRDQEESQESASASENRADSNDSNDSNVPNESDASRARENDLFINNNLLINNKNNNKSNNKETNCDSFEVAEESEEENAPDASLENRVVSSSENRASNSTVDDALAQVDRTSARFSAIRAKLARSIYEQGLHADLVDRMAGAAILGLADMGEFRDAITRAKEEKELRVKSNGFRGKQFLWQTLCPIVKSWYESAGYSWLPTSNRLETAPIARTAEPHFERPAFDEEKILRDHDQIRGRMRKVAA